MAAGHPVSVDLMRSIQLGATREQLMATLGKPASQQVRFRVMGDRKRTIERDNYRYTDGRSLYTYIVTDREVTDIFHEDPKPSRRTPSSSPPSSNTSICAWRSSSAASASS